MKNIILIGMVLALAAGSAFADPPPAHGLYPGGWGMNLTCWEDSTGYWNSGLMLYNPLSPNDAGHKWIVNWNDPQNPGYVAYSPIELKLYVELGAYEYYECLEFDWHRIGNLQETIHFFINGRISANNPLWVGLVNSGEPLTHLYFRHDIFGAGGPIDNGNNIPITWFGRWGDGTEWPQDPGQGPTWNQLTVNCGGDLYMHITASCDHWFQFQGEFDIPYHIDDGYYSLTIGGCPSPEL